MANALVQQASQVNGGSATSSVVFGANNAAGNLLVLEVDVFSDSTTIGSVVDTAGNTWALAQGAPSNSLGERTYIYYAKNCVGAANTVTATISAASGLALRVAEYSGLDTVAPLGPVGSGSGAASVPSVTLSAVPAGSLLVGMGVSAVDIAPDTGYTSLYNSAANFFEESIYALDSGASGSKTVLWTGAGSWTAAAVAFLPAASISISSVSTAIPYNGQTGITITGTGFGASQGTGAVYISPSNSVADAGKVSQTVTAWSNTSITFTAVKGSLSFDTASFLFVKENGGTSNASGTAIQIQAKPNVRENLITETGAVVASVSGITMAVFHTLPTTASPNPFEVIENVATDGSGAIDVRCQRGALALSAPIWVALMKDGTPAKGTVRKVTPVYE